MNNITNTTTGLNDDQQMLADSAIRYLERGYADAQRIASTAHIHGCDPARWAEFAELGWLALAIPEESGGLGGSLADFCVLAEQLGRGLVVEPVVAGAALAGMLLADLPPGALQGSWLADLASGAKRLAFAPWEQQARHQPAAVAMRADANEGGWSLQGGKSLAPGAAGADGFLLAARTGGGTLGLFLVERQARGLQVDACALYDGRHACALRLEGVTDASLLHEGSDDEILQIINHALDRVTIAHAAETVGTMAQALDITRDYVGTRKQFGRAIATNQVIQHRLVDLFVEIEEARSLVRAASSAPTPRMAAACGAYISQAARHVWEESIQLHGAIGMTEEYTIGRYVRRLALAASLYGDSHHHLSRLAAISLGEPV
ncbi:MAG: acyl-CoA dehydrogenase family protein [Bdellovibrionales bacterium]|nr:acyl-CoA dehydrogenase family protein [Ramlibacter sp.]